MDSHHLVHICKVFTNITVHVHWINFFKFCFHTKRIKCHVYTVSILLIAQVPLLLVLIAPYAHI